MLKKAKAAAERDGADDTGERGATRRARRSPTRARVVAPDLARRPRRVRARARAKARRCSRRWSSRASRSSRGRAAAAADTASAAREAAQAKAKEMQAKAGGTWDKLEQVFEDRVARALSRLGVHTQADVARLTERVDALSDAVNQLIRTSGGTPVARRQVAARSARPRRRRRPRRPQRCAGRGEAPRSAHGRPSGAAPDDAAGRRARRARRHAASRRRPAALSVRRLQLFVATSVDGYVERTATATRRGATRAPSSVTPAWPRVDTILMGRRTYEAACAAGVAARRSTDRRVRPHGRAVDRDAAHGGHRATPADVVAELRAREGGSIALVARRRAHRPHASRRQLVDDVFVAMHPLLLGGGTRWLAGAGAVDHAVDGVGATPAVGRACSSPIASSAAALLAIEPLDLPDVGLHRVVAARALELRPRVVFAPPTKSKPPGRAPCTSPSVACL